MRSCEILSSGSLPLGFVNHVVLKSCHLGAFGPSELKKLSHETVQEKWIISDTALLFNLSKAKCFDVVCPWKRSWFEGQKLCYVRTSFSEWEFDQFKWWVLKSLLLLMISSSVATGLAHSKLIIWTDQMLIYLPKLVCGFWSVWTVVFTVKTS